MFKICGVRILPLIWLAVISSAAQVQAPPFGENTPGTTLRAEPLQEVTVPMGTFHVSTKNMYVLKATGFSPRERLKLWIIAPGQTPPPDEASVDASGQVCVVGKHRTLPVLLEIRAKPKGLTYILGLATMDGETHAWTRFTANPIEERDGSCHVSAEMEKRLGETYLVSGSGFQPGEELKIRTEWEKENQESTEHARADGTWQGRVTLAEPKKESLKAKFTLSTQSCKLTVTLERFVSKAKKK